jgi:hypothetical protein
MALPGAGMTHYAHGLVKMVGIKQLLEEERRASEATQNQQVIIGLAGHVRQAWTWARTAKQTSVESRMLKSLRQRRGEYDPDVMSRIRQQGGSDIFMMLTSTKCRAAASWLRDTLLGTSTDKPWGIEPSPLPDLPPQVAQSIHNLAMTQAQQFMQMNGVPPTPEMVETAKKIIKEQIISRSEDEAKRAAAQMESKMEDQLVEGGWYKAFSQFLDDIVTFPAAILKGPVVRNKPRMMWVNGELVVDNALTLEWERVDPFELYPSPQSSDIDDGSLIERHRMTRGALNELIGVEGYDDGAIKAVIEDYGRGGLREWLTNDLSKAEAEGKSSAQVAANPDHLIDALQYWGSVPGQQLLDWGMSEEQVPEPSKEYQCEVWLIGRWVIKATLNPDPLGRRPYYKASYEDIPGAFWGNSVADLVRDMQSMCNSAARALANNMGISSGPQVWVDVSRLPDGEDITEVFPWKIWQGTSDVGGGGGRPIEFFQPESFVGPLMQVYQQFSTLADEYSGVPRYMTGTEGAGGAGRTASGLSMMVGNAGKAIKQVIGNIDVGVLRPMVERLYFYNMRYSDDPDLKGDVNMVAQGANQLVVKELAAVRRNEFMQMALQNPVVGGIVGPKGIAALLREAAKAIDMDVGDMVPSDAALRAKELLAQQQQAVQAHIMQQVQVSATPMPPTPSEPPQQGMTPSVQQGSGQNLMDGSPVVNNFQNS